MQKMYNILTLKIDLPVKSHNTINFYHQPKCIAVYVHDIQVCYK